MSRVGAIQAEKKQRDEGGYGNDRKWYIASEQLDAEGMKQFKAKEGTNFLRIIPPESSDVYFGLQIFVHYNMGPNKDAFACPRMMKKVLLKRNRKDLAEKLIEDCPICKRREDLQAQGVAPAVLKALSCFPPRYLFIAVDVTSPESEKLGPQLYDAPQTVNDEILGLSRDRRTGQMVDISDPDTGMVLIFDREGTGAMDTKYKAFELDKGTAIPDAWLDVPHIEDLLHFGTHNEMIEVLGAVPREDEPADPPSSSGSVAPTVDAVVGVRRRRAPVQEATPPPAAAPAQAEPPVRRRRVPREGDSGADAEAPAAAPAPAPAPAPAAPAAEEATPAPTGSADASDASRLRERLARRRKQAEG